MCGTRKVARTIPLGFTEERFPEGQHICYVFNNDAEQRRTMAKFLDSGIQAREKVLYLVDSVTTREMLDCLEELGVDVHTKAGAFTVTGAGKTYCPRGFFSPDDMLKTVREFYAQAVHEEGYEGVRIAGEMSWFLAEGSADLASLLEYEARLNFLFEEFPCTACCLYDARRFDGSFIMEMLTVHPVMIVCGQLVKNPDYIEPDVFLREHQARAGSN